MSGLAGLRRPGAAELARAALGIAVVTVLARAVGFGRTAVLARAVGPTCLGDVYVSANTVPNVVFEVVAGGALAAMVVPVLAGPLAAGDVATARRIVSALLGWVALLLVPVAVLGTVLAPLLVDLLLAGGSGSGGTGCDAELQVAVGARMLVVFMPQVVLYGAALVLVGALQAQRRFYAPALAPLLSSLVVVTAYLAYAVAREGEPSLAGLSRAEELTLSVGTTLGVVVLAASLLPALARSPLGLAPLLRPRLRFPPGVARPVLGLAAAGAVVLGAQQVFTVVAIVLANRGSSGDVVLYGVAWAVYLVPWAVLAVPIATSAFPTLAARVSEGDVPGFARVVAAALRALLLTTLLSVAVVVGTAAPVSRVLVAAAPGDPAVRPLALALVAFAPGLVGYGVVALHGRALLALGRRTASAAATAVGWGVAVLAALLAALLLPPEHRVAALGLGSTVGMTVAGVLLVAAVRRGAGPETLRGAPRTLAAGGVAAVAGAAAGQGVAALLGEAGPVLSALHAAASALVVLVVFALVAVPGAGTADLRAALRGGRDAGAAAERGAEPAAGAAER